MEYKEGKYLTTNNQPLKQITYQNIYQLKELSERLDSWIKPLSGVHEFFSDREIPLNKKKVMREFHANAVIFTAFYQQFSNLVSSVEKQIDELASKEKLKI
jgi:hypothetical protein